MRYSLVGITSLILFLFIAIIASLAIGPYKGVTLSDAVSYIIGWYSGGYSGILHYRLTRTLAALVAGASLAGSGLALQYTLRNPLADPYLLGVSSGAALGVLLLLYYAQAPPVYGVYSIAFISGLAGFSIVVAVSVLMGLSATALIVAGVSISYLLGGASMILLIRLGDRIPGAASWLFGTVAYVTLDQVLYTFIASSIGLTGLILLSRRIATLILGEEFSSGVGVRVGRLRVIVSILAALSASSVVALSGPIGFIGVAGPWIARLITGSWFPTTLVASMLAGSLLTLFSDISVRVIGGGELPLTAISSIYGGLVLFYLTARSGREL